MSHDSPRINWSAVPIVFIPLPPRPACPACQSTRQPIITRSEDQGDGSILRKCVCRDCNEPFRIVAEPDEPLPVIGKFDESSG